MYVGQTAGTLAERFAHHISAVRYKDRQHFKVVQWVKEILAEDLIPTIEHIERDVPNDQVDERERHWIAHHRKENPDLLNASSGGKGNHKLTEEDHAEILKCFERADQSHGEISQKYGVNEETIGRLYRKHFPGQTYSYKPRGSKHANSKLNERKVREIRKMLSEGMPQRDVATHFGVTQPLIGQVNRREIWSHVT